MSGKLLYRVVIAIEGRRPTTIETDDEELAMINFRGASARKGFKAVNLGVIPNPDYSPQQQDERKRPRDDEQEEDDPPAPKSIGRNPYSIGQKQSDNEEAKKPIAKQPPRAKPKVGGGRIWDNAKLEVIALVEQIKKSEETGKAKDLQFISTCSLLIEKIQDHLTIFDFGGDPVTKVRWEKMLEAAKSSKAEAEEEQKKMRALEEERAARASAAKKPRQTLPPKEKEDASEPSLPIQKKAVKWKDLDNDNNDGMIEQVEDRDEDEDDHAEMMTEINDDDE